MPTPSSFTRILFLMLACVAGTAQAGFAGDDPLRLTTRSQVDDTGRVTVELEIENRSARPLHHLHPMFHFHHTMAHMPMIHLLNPGESRRLVNKEHPAVVREGSYPVVAMVRYKEQEDGPATFTQVHTDSFFFKKPLLSQIEGSIEARVDEDNSLLKIVLKNSSASFKNIRLMLLLPPELKSETFRNMQGFTIRGGEEKYFEVPVQKIGGMPGGEFPVHLLIEYGELMNHYSGEVVGRIDFGPLWSRGPLWPQLLVFLFISAGLLGLLRRRLQATPAI